MLEVLPSFESENRCKLLPRWGATAALLGEIEAGATGDVVLLTAEAIDRLIGTGKAVPGSRTDLARSAIGIAVRSGARKPDISSPQALKRTLLEARSVAHSKSGLSGLYFPEVLTRLGIATAMKDKIVIPEPGTPVGQVVASGQAELGIQQISELVPVPGVEIAGPLPDELQKITTFSAGILTSSGNRAAAAGLLQFLRAAFPPLLEDKGLEAA